MEVMRLNLGSGLVSLAPIPGTATVRVFADRACVRWRGQLEIEESRLQAMLNAQTGAALFDERDEFDILYRTRHHIAKRLPGTSVHSDVHAHWFIELLDLETKQRFIFTSAEWNALFTCHATGAMLAKKVDVQEAVTSPPAT